MSQDKTSLFSIKDIDNELVRTILSEVWDALEERGYNPSNQIVGYLISGDPGYISSINIKNEIFGFGFRKSNFRNCN